MRDDRVALANHAYVADKAREVVKRAKIAAEENRRYARKLANDAHLDFKRFV